MSKEQQLIAKFHKFYNSLPKGRDSQGRILKIVSCHDGISQRKLQEIVGIKPGSLSEVILKLEKLGYIIRKQDKNDKRRWNVFITEAGTEAFAEIHKAHEEESAHVFDALNEAEMQELSSILNKLIGDNESFKYDKKRNNDGGFEG